jgi:NTP pyrophosphatase (non-canonical NTP hydrolase)
MRQPEFSIEQIKAFVANDHQSVSARYCKSMMQHYDNQNSGTEDLYNEIVTWCATTFGADRDPNGITEHLREEAMELSREVNKQTGGWAKDRQDLLCEIADVQILLWNIVSRMGICYNSYIDGIRIKHSINLKRKWKKVGNLVKHVK